MKFPDVDLKELEKLKQKNIEARLKFIEKYAEWLKKRSDKEWSSEQKKIID
jgi:hypothetical protein